jgi:RNA polymerase sigma factor (sigma-70 family)
MPVALDSLGPDATDELRRRAPDQTAEMWARYVAGEEDAATKLFQRYLERLTALARSRLSAALAARVDADDVVMSAYRSLFVSGRDGRFSISQPGELWRLLVEITLHKLYRQAAHHLAGKRSVRAERGGAQLDDSVWQPQAKEPSPDAAAALAEELAAIMAQLTPAARRAVELRLQGESPPVIAADIGCSERTVRRHLAQARQVILGRQAAEAGRGTQHVASQPRAAWDAAQPAPRRQANTADSDPDAPLAFGDFLLQRQLGAGGIGKVYQALHHLTGEVVAVKYLKKTYVRHPNVVARFLHEARLVARFDHPGIVRVRGLGRTPNRGYFLAMDLMRGGDLARRMGRGSMSMAEIGRWMRQIAGAVAYAHRHGVIHCDLKPSNILLDERGNALVTDFGLAVAPATDIVRPWAIAGTPAYMAPEQIDPVWGPITARTDVFGLGAILFALLTGQPPHSGRRTADVLADAVSGKPVPQPSTIRPDVSPELESICIRCLAKTADQRYSSALEFDEALSAVSASGSRPW